MILHADRYFEHLYDVRLDMVSVKWPDIESIYLPEIFNSVNKLVENVRNYNIRNLLIDASHTKLLSTYEDADKVVKLFLNGLAQSRLEKLARVESANTTRESSLRILASEINATYNYEIKFFSDYTGALRWLENGKSLNGSIS